MRATREKVSRFSIAGFFLFFVTIMITSTSAIFVYYLAHRDTSGQTWIVALAVLGVIIVGAVLCTLCDILRRRVMIDKPVKMIMNATEKIASGDFSVRLEPLHEYSKYDQYDLIFDNINTMAAELSKNEILHNDFMSNVSHEIKTPLAVIQNHVKMLQNTKLSSDRRQEYLANIVDQSQKLSNLIGNILKLNKLENRQTMPEMESFDLAELLRRTVLSFENLFEDKNIELICDIDECIITSSASLLELAFNNLISNAIKFTDKNGKVSVKLHVVDKYVVIQFSDTGCGISKTEGQHIFDKFYQADSSRASEGNGLGLALVKKVIDIIGGEIYVESKVGHGSTFTIKLKKD